MASRRNPNARASSRSLGKSFALANRSSGAEAASYAEFLNHLLKPRVSQFPELAVLIPIEKPELLFPAVADGMLLAVLLDTMVPGSIEIGRYMGTGPFKVRERNNAVVERARALGCAIVNISGDDLESGKPHAVLGLIWQILQVGLSIQIRAAASALGLVFGADLEADAILLRWVNSTIAGTPGCPAEVTNLGSDLADSVVLTHVLHKVAPTMCTLAPLAESDLEVRADAMLREAAKIEARAFATPMDVASGASRMCFALCASIFLRVPALRGLALDMTPFVDGLNAATPSRSPRRGGPSTPTSSKLNNFSKPLPKPTAKSAAAAAPSPTAKPPTAPQQSPAAAAVAKSGSSSLASSSASSTSSSSASSAAAAAAPVVATPAPTTAAVAPARGTAAAKAPSAAVACNSDGEDGSDSDSSGSSSDDDGVPAASAPPAGPDGSAPPKPAAFRRHAGASRPMSTYVPGEGALHRKIVEMEEENQSKARAIERLTEELRAARAAESAAAASNAQLQAELAASRSSVERAASKLSQAADAAVSDPRWLAAAGDETLQRYQEDAAAARSLAERLQLEVDTLRQAQSAGADAAGPSKQLADRVAELEQQLASALADRGRLRETLEELDRQIEQRSQLMTALDVLERRFDERVHELEEERDKIGQTMERAHSQTLWLWDLSRQFRGLQTVRVTQALLREDAAADAALVTKSGQMSVQGYKKHANWRRRFFVLQRGVLFMFKRQDDKLRGCKFVALAGCGVTRVRDAPPPSDAPADGAGAAGPQSTKSSSKHSYVLKLTTPSGYHLVCAVGSSAELSAWIGALLEAGGVEILAVKEPPKERAVRSHKSSKILTEK